MTETFIEEFTQSILGLIILLIPILIAKKIKKNKKLKNDLLKKDLEIQKLKEEKLNEAYFVFPYVKCNILTEREKIFYSELKKIAKNLNYNILAKIRLGDLIKINSDLNQKQQTEYIYKILYKHIDFALCDKETLEPKILIELQDKTHEIEDRIISDRFKKTALEKCGYKIIFTYSANNLENKIKELIK